MPFEKGVRKPPRRAAGKEVNGMDIKTIDDLKMSLFEFVKRAAAEGATAEEVKALPAVASVLIALMGCS